MCGVTFSTPRAVQGGRQIKSPQHQPAGCIPGGRRAAAARRAPGGALTAASVVLASCALPQTAPRSRLISRTARSGIQLIHHAPLPGGPPDAPPAGDDADSITPPSPEEPRCLGPAAWRGETPASSSTPATPATPPSSSAPPALPPAPFPPTPDPPAAAAAAPPPPLFAGFIQPCTNGDTNTSAAPLPCKEIARQCKSKSAKRLICAGRTQCTEHHARSRALATQACIKPTRATEGW